MSTIFTRRTTRVSIQQITTPRGLAEARHISYWAMQQTTRRNTATGKSRRHSLLWSAKASMFRRYPLVRYCWDFIAWSDPTPQNRRCPRFSLILHSYFGHTSYTLIYGPVRFWRATCRVYRVNASFSIFDCSPRRYQVARAFIAFGDGLTMRGFPALLALLAIGTANGKSFWATQHPYLPVTIFKSSNKHCHTLPQGLATRRV